MVLRVALCMFSLTLLLFSTNVSSGIAGGPPVCPPPACAPAPQYCAPQPCGPPPCSSSADGGSPFGLCGGIIGACSGICGACISAPAAVMRIILAPPAPRQSCPPPMCAPPPCPPPACGPPACGPYMAPAYSPYACPPQPVRKCKPAAKYCAPANYYAPPMGGFPPFMQAPRADYMPYPVPAPVSMIQQLIEMPFRLVSGSLVTPLEQSGLPVVAKKAVVPGIPDFVGYW
jgi:hypothetical protein